MRRIQVDPNANDSKVRKYSQVVENDVLHKVDFTKVTTEQSTSVSSVAWTSVGRREADISGATESSGVASAYISSEYSGFATIEVKATLANGNYSTVYFEIQFEDPEGV